MNREIHSSTDLLRFGNCGLDMLGPFLHAQYLTLFFSLFFSLLFFYLFVIYHGTEQGTDITCIGRTLA
ncbi:hypothetical protein BDW74DRAFT_152381 [Aspergillus multicolor]|uniref:uncharacterized protein n=1 Tax=Aspergillus multicolor TaxID=41759 RepID=UPI003CCCC7CF